MRSIPTTPFAGQKPGTSGLRKKTTVFQQPGYVENFVQATFDALPNTTFAGETLLVGGDGRFYNLEMCQTIVRLAHGNGFARVLVPQHGLISTPAVSRVIRTEKCLGAFILTASHNPGGPLNDVGIKFNTANGGPANEQLTDEIYKQTMGISRYLTSTHTGDVDLAVLGTTTLGGDNFTVEVFDGTSEYVKMITELFDVPLLRGLLAREDFEFVFDGMSGVGGPFARRVFKDLLGVPEASLLNCDPSLDFNGGHPDPNLTYAPELVERMGLERDGTVLALDKRAKRSVPDFGAAADGDADRNMILGREFFVTPSDSLAVLAANVSQSVPYFAGGIRCIARSMPTSCAVDLVAKKLGVPLFEVPTGWKFFVNLCEQQDLYVPLLCGEESFGTGSSHIREKDGIFAVLCWLSVLAWENRNPLLPLVSVRDVVTKHWREFGRNHYQRYDYEELPTQVADAFTRRLTQLQLDKQDVGHGFALSLGDEFCYHDSVDGSVSEHQGWRFLLRDGSRFVFRLSGTGSSGATVRLYLEKFTPATASDLLDPPGVALRELVAAALEFAQVRELLERAEPTVIT